ncbi:YdaU family protein [Burkholderia cenocepacia]|uniref:YdaU family protein n=1 Tax=Burkholderia cenocepacia TaxID=95486 RepID=UPI001B973783|nr:YdaU family protein [Burkholderia cenocepacia]MBR7942339.1 YdaU family protein [Burkholderia cenocepacia]
MNFYKRHIGDYLKDTAHLSLLEHGVYTRLLDVYYTRESGIPDDQAARLIGARARDELSALKVVLGEFFELVDGTWVQQRCEREIHAAGGQQEGDGEAPRSGKAMRQKQYRERRKAMFDRLRDLGVTMAFDASMDDLHDALLRATSASRVMPETSRVTDDITGVTHNVTATNSQTPEAISQKPQGEQGARYADTPAGERVRPGELSAAMREHSIEASPHDPRIIAAAERGVTPATIRAACAEAKAAKPNERIPPAYVLSIANRWLADAAQPLPAGRAPQQPRMTAAEQRNAVSDRNAEAWLNGRADSDPTVIDMEP